MEKEDKLERIELISKVKNEGKLKQTEQTSKPEGKDKSENLKRSSKDEDLFQQADRRLLEEEEDKGKQIRQIQLMPEVEGEDEPEHAQNTYGKFLVFKSSLGLTALPTGAFYANVGREYCPWSPHLPGFLLTFGIYHLVSSAIIFLFVRLYATLSNKIKIFFVSLVIDIGLIIWGLVILYSPSEEATYFEYEHVANETYSRNENYCFKVLYLMPMIIIWASVPFYIFIGLFVCCCLTAVNVCDFSLRLLMKIQDPGRSVIPDQSPKKSPCVMEEENPT